MSEEQGDHQSGRADHAQNNRKHRFVTNQSSEAIQYQWKSKWLKGEQYAHMLKNIDSYSDRFGFAKYPNKTHPQTIYSNPENGAIYFVEANSIGSQFGFPRVSIKKKFRWKKMNFTTDLPKKRPAVTYIVASAVKCQKFFPNSKNEGPLFRMHAVMPYKGDPKLSKQSSQKEKLQSMEKQGQPCYVLCHIRKLDANYKGQKKKMNTITQSDESSELIDKDLGLNDDLQQNSLRSKENEMLPEESSNQTFTSFFRETIDYFGLFKFLHNQNHNSKDGS